MSGNFKNFSEFVNEEKDGNDKDLKKEYEDFFNKMLKKYGVDSPDELSGDEEKDFYNEIDLGWDEGEGISAEGKKLLKSDRKVDKDEKSKKNENLDYSPLSNMTKESFQNFDNNFGEIFDQVLNAIKENVDSENYYDIAIDYLKMKQNN